MPRGPKPRRVGTGRGNYRSPPPRPHPPATFPAWLQSLLLARASGRGALSPGVLPLRTPVGIPGRAGHLHLEGPSHSALHSEKGDSLLPGGCPFLQRWGARGRVGEELFNLACLYFAGTERERHLPPGLTLQTTLFWTSLPARRTWVHTAPGSGGRLWLNAGFPKLTIYSKSKACWCESPQEGSGTGQEYGIGGRHGPVLGLGRC